jgi:hypothetical protein
MEALGRVRKEADDRHEGSRSRIIPADNKAMAEAVKKAVYAKHAKPLQSFIERVQAVK